MDEKIYNKINVFLGGPLRQVELTNPQIDVAHEDATTTFNLYKTLHTNTDNLSKFNSIENIWIQKYTLANCKEILGRIRGKFDGSLNIPESVIKMDYHSLLDESKSEKQILILILEKI